MISKDSLLKPRSIFGRKRSSLESINAGTPFVFDRSQLRGRREGEVRVDPLRGNDDGEKPESFSRRGK